MANQVANVSAGKPKIGGAVFRAPAGTAIPTAADAALSEAFVCMGYCSEDGLTNSNSPEGDKIRAWGGDVVYAYQSAKDDTFTFTLIESLNVDVLKAVYGDDNVTGTLETGVTVRANSQEAESAVWVFDMIARGGKAIRIAVPDGKISALGEIGYKDTSLSGFAITLLASPDGDGNTHYEYIK